MEHPRRRLNHDDYTVACICPMGVELAPVVAMLDEMHERLPASRDTNSYTLGHMGAHNIVIAVMPEIGNNSASTVATQLLNDFRSIRFGLLVGIGGGVPSDEDDIRLGDVVVSKPTATFGGVVQFDKGKIHSNGQFERTGTLKNPPAVLMANMQSLDAQHRISGNKISEYLSDMLKRFPNLEEQGYVYPVMERDQLFEASYIHKGGKTCQSCDESKAVKRAPRKNTTPRIHYGTIGSANEVVKDSKTRDKLREDLGILCVEMEAAGLVDEFSCVVIRGICDYADSHKNKSWQPYAAATAAAYAKELLSIIPAQEIVTTTKAADDLRDQNRVLNELPHIVDAAAQSKFNEGKPTCLDATRVDLLHRIETWVNNAHGKYLFWLNGMAGTGKSTIARTVAHRFDSQERLGASFFFSRDKEDLSTTSQFFSTIAYQLANFSPTFKRAISQAIQNERDITRLATSIQWKQLILQPLQACKFQCSIIIVIDALDECKDQAAVGDILRLLTQAKGLFNVRLRVFVTARPESHIRQSFDDLHESVYRVNLHDIDADNDISNFVRHELKETQKERPGLDADWPGEENIEDLAQRANGLFIYAATACRFIGPRTSPRRIRQQRLSLILNAEGDRLGAKTSGRSSTQELDIMYTQIVMQSIAGDYDEDEKEMMTED